VRAQALTLLVGVLLVGSVAWAPEPIVMGEIKPLTEARARQGASIHQGYPKECATASAVTGSCVDRRHWSHS